MQRVDGGWECWAVGAKDTRVTSGAAGAARQGVAQWDKTRTSKGYKIDFGLVHIKNLFWTLWSVQRCNVLPYRKGYWSGKRLDYSIFRIYFNADIK